MRKRKKLAALGLAGMMAVSALTGCSSGGATESKASNPESQKVSPAVRRKRKLHLEKR